MNQPIVMTNTATVPSCPGLDTAGTVLSNLSVKNLAIFVDYSKGVAAEKYSS